jgi:hypothetical protein
MEMPQSKNSLQRRLEESRAGDSREDYYASVERLVGAPLTPRVRLKRQPFGDAAPPEPPPEKLSVGGFAENVIKDGFDFVKGIFDTVVLSVAGHGKLARGGYDLITDPAARDDLQFVIKNPSVVLDGAWNTGKSVANAIAEPYREHPTTFWYHRPVGTMADALFLVTMGGGSIAKAGRLAGSARLEAVGKAMSSSPGKMLRKVEDAAIKHIGRQDPATFRLSLAMKGEEFGAAPHKTLTDMEQAGKYVKGLSEQEAELFHRWRTQGASKAEMAAQPKVAEAFEKYRNLAEGTWAPTFTAPGLLDDAQRAEVIAKKYAHEVFGEITDETVAAAKAAIASVEVKPVYGRSYVQGMAEGADDFARDITGRSVVRTGKAGMLEKYGGAKGDIKDPRVYVPKSIAEFRQTEARLRWMQRMAQEPSLLQPATAAEASKALTVSEGGVLSKYFDDITARAKAAYVRDVYNTHGSEKAMELLIGDKGTRRGLYQVSTMIANPTVRRIVAGEFSRAGGPLGVFLRTYDAILGVFRKSATRWNPKWYTGNAVGDGVLSVVAGVTAGDWRMAKRLLDSMPPHLRKGLGTAQMAGETGKLQSLADFVGEIDNATRRGIITKELAGKLKAAGNTFYASEAALTPVIRAPFNLSEAQVQIQLLQERIANSVPAIRQIDKGIIKAAKEADETALARLYAERNASIADYRATWQKMAEKNATVPELQAMTAQFREAERVANAFVGNYNAMDPFEQAVFRRIVPFYTWSKAMTLLAFRLPFLRPGTAFAWDKLAAAMGSMAGDDELPEWLAGYFPVFARQNGDVVWARLAGWNPAAGVKTASFGDVTVPNLVAFWESNPFISTGYKLIGGKTVFDQRSVPYGEPMVSLGNGDVYEFSEDGKLRETIPQAPLISTLVHMFPSTQLIEQLIQPYAVAEGNIPVVWQKPVLNPDGSTKYPKELWEMLYQYGTLTAGPRVIQKNPEAAKEQEQRKIREAVLRYRALYHRSDPETKKVIEQRLTDYANGRYRKIAR